MEPAKKKLSEEDLEKEAQQLSKIKANNQQALTEFQQRNPFNNSRTIVRQQRPQTANNNIEKTIRDKRLQAQNRNTLVGNARAKSSVSEEGSGEEEKGEIDIDEESKSEEEEGKAEEGKKNEKS